MQRYNRRAFSLIELMVVIAIIGILASIAVPSYRSYVLKSKIASAIPILEAATKKPIIDFNIKGNFPDTMTFGGVTISQGNGNFSSLNAPPVARLDYWHGTGGVPAGTILVCVRVAGLDGMVSNYVAPSPSNYGLYSRLCMHIREVNGVIQKQCGTWRLGSSEIPHRFLPNNCQCDVATYTGEGC